MSQQQTSVEIKKPLRAISLAPEWPELSLIIEGNMAEMDTSWDASFNNILLSSDYLQAVEQAAPARMDFLYVLLLEKNKPIARAYFQIVHFNASKSLGQDLSTQEAPCKQSFFKGLNKAIKDSVAKNIDFYTLVSGNLLLTGQNGIEFIQEKDMSKNLDLLRMVHRHARNYAEQNYQSSLPVFLLKELYPKNRLPKAFIREASLHEFCIQPNFVFSFQDNWTCFEDYLDALKAKYRIRAKRARKKANGVIVKSLNAQEISEYKAELNQLYAAVANQIGFNMIHLHPDYFLAVKKAMGDRFQIKCFVWEGEIIGFYSYFIADQEIIAHYVGFDPHKSQEKQLYLNMLLDLIDIGILHRAKTLNLGRTAHEIKSSVGAEAVDMYCYLRHRNKLYQAMVPGLLDYLSPRESWEVRHPFK